MSAGPDASPAVATGVDGDDALVTAYLVALGLPDLREQPPSPAALTSLHRAHVQRFAHDTVWIARGRIPALDARAMVTGLLAGEGGVCNQLGFGFGWLLGRLGYDVRLHEARVELTFGTEFRDWPLHPVLTVGFEDATWYADVGMGNGLLEPVPCAEGEIAQPGGFTYSLEPAGPAGVWEFLQDPRMRGVRRLRFDQDRDAPVEGFGAGFQEMVTHRDSPYRNTIGASLRQVDGVVVLTGNALTRQGTAGRTRTRLADAAEWESVLRDVFHLGLPDWSTQERDRLWGRIVEGAR